MKKHLSLLLASLLIFAALATGCSPKAEPADPGTATPAQTQEPAQPQEPAPINYPTRAIDLIVPGAAGSSTDLQARIIASYLADALGKPVNVVNREGGGSVTGTLSVYDADADGYTLLVDSGSWSSFQLADESQTLPYNVMDREFICKISVGETFLCCNADMPWQTLEDVAKAVQEDPESFVYGGLGGLSVTDFAPMAFLKETGVDLAQLTKLTFSGGGKVMAGLAGGSIQFCSGGYATTLPFVQGGTVRPLAVISETRNPNLPDVPTTAEAGYPQVVMRSWVGLSGPPELPEEIAEKLDATVAKMVEDPEFLAEMETLYAHVNYVSRENMETAITDEAELIKELLS